MSVSFQQFQQILRESEPRDPNVLDTGNPDYQRYLNVENPHNWQVKYRMSPFGFDLIDPATNKIEKSYNFGNAMRKLLKAWQNASDEMDYAPDEKSMEFWNEQRGIEHEKGIVLMKKGMGDLAGFTHEGIAGLFEYMAAWLSDNSVA